MALLALSRLEGLEPRLGFCNENFSRVMRWVESYGKAMTTTKE